MLYYLFTTHFLTTHLFYPQSSIFSYSFSQGTTHK
jgi:hypothetical protein